DEATHERIESKLAETYPVSGLYKRGSTDPIWSIGNYYHRVEISSDGRYLIAWAKASPFAQEYRSLNFDIYKDGKQIKSISGNSFQRENPLPNEIFGGRITPEYFDASTNLLTLKTSGFDRFEIDISTGDFEKVSTDQAKVREVYFDFYVLPIIGLLILLFTFYVAIRVTIDLVVSLFHKEEDH
ncbi:MAG: hypothetical protein AAGD96_17405, partial [Chloroflexota bacterium]